MTTKNNLRHSGFVAIIGRPNVGKSTLLNMLVGEKISIISDKPQTTRWQILGIKTLPHAQLIFVDTPGLHQGEARAMNRYLNRIAKAVMLDADVIVFMMDATYWHREDESVLQKLSSTQKPVLLALNKVDLVKDKQALLPLIDKLKDKYAFAGIYPISAATGENARALEEEIARLLPEGPFLYPEDQLTDRPERFIAAEIIREKLILATEQELPYTTAVEIEQWVEGDKHDEISAVIWVERRGQKAIIIGKQGAKLKKIGMQARVEIEERLGKKIFLRLWVKVRKNWTDDERALKSFGYQS